MYSILRNAKCETVVEVQSISASASSTMMCGATTVRLSPVAQVMIHLPATCTWGNQNDHRHSAGILESLTQSILNGYALRCGDKASREKLEDLTNKETWLTAQDAVLLGLANEVMYQEGEVEFRKLSLKGRLCRKKALATGPNILLQVLYQVEA